MAKIPCSRSISTSVEIEETTSKMTPDETIFTNVDTGLINNIDSSYCDKCKIIKVKSGFFCKECGDLFLCSECNKKVHSETKVKHSFQNVSCLKESSEKISCKTIVESNLFKNVAKLNVTREDNHQQSFLLIDGSENIKVR